MNAADKENNDELRKQTLCNVFHMVRTAAVLIHPLAPDGTEMLREYFGFGEDFWSWDRISDTLYDFCGDCNEYKLKFLEPKIDFFKKHLSQLEF
jgi:methionyl-tRNA synthetase